MTKLAREAKGSQRQARAVVKPPEMVLAFMPHPAVFVYVGCVETLTEVYSQRTEWSHSLLGNVHLWRQKHE